MGGQPGDDVVDTSVNADDLEQSSRHHRDDDELSHIGDARSHR